MSFRLGDLLRYGVFGLVVTLLVALILAPFASGIVEQWSRADVEARSRLVFNAIEPSLDSAVEQRAWPRLSPLFERVALDKRILAVGFCNSAGALMAQSREMPASFSCEKIARSEKESFSNITTGGRQILVAAFPIAFPIAAGTGHSYLVILTDLSFVGARAGQVVTYMVAAIAGVTLVLLVGGSIFALRMLRNWMNSLKRAVEAVRQGNSDMSQASAGSAVEREIRKLLRESEHVPVADQIDWTPKSLHELLRNALPGAEVLVVSNREPYIHNRSAAGIVTQTPASGLVAALEPIMRACGGTWIAHGSGSADRDMVDAHDRIQVPEVEPAYTLRRVWITEEEQDGYYYGFANEGLWPLCHIVFVRPTLRARDWELYQAINRRFADAVVAEARCEDPVVLVQDYHFALVPKMIRERLPKATVIAFWHIPWPNAETFSICPWKEDIIEGLLGSTIVGFHTQFHCNNFIECVDRFLESRIDREIQAVSFSGHEALIRPYPISIDWPPKAIGSIPASKDCAARTRAEFKLPDDVKIVVGVERFDYTKGILDRLKAVDALLTRAPGWKDRFVFIQIAAPTRSKLDTYSALQAEAKALAEEINGRHRCRFGPIKLIVSHYEQKDVFRLFRSADACVVSSLHDGMNLVAKEFVASRENNTGVLVLSSFTGASRELLEALIVNPYDTEEMATAIELALTMPVEEQVERMKLMREQIRENNVYRWAGRMLIDAARSRKRERIMGLATSLETPHPGVVAPTVWLPVAKRSASSRP